MSYDLFVTIPKALQLEAKKKTNICNRLKRMAGSDECEIHRHWDEKDESGNEMLLSISMGGDEWDYMHRVFKLTEKEGLILEDPQIGKKLEESDFQDFLEEQKKLPKKDKPVTFPTLVKRYFKNELIPEGWEADGKWSVYKRNGISKQIINFQPGTGRLKGKFTINLFNKFIFNEEDGELASGCKRLGSIAFGKDYWHKANEEGMEEARKLMSEHGFPWLEKTSDPESLLALWLAVKPWGGYDSGLIGYPQTRFLVIAFCYLLAGKKEEAQMYFHHIESLTERNAEQKHIELIRNRGFEIKPEVEKKRLASWDEWLERQDQDKLDEPYDEKGSEIALREIARLENES